MLIEACKAKQEDILLVYSKEANASKSLNIYLIVKVLKLFKKHMPDYIYQFSSEFVNLISTLFMIPMIFRKEFDLHKEIYLFIYKTLVPIAKNPSKYNDDLKAGLLRMRIFKNIIEKINYGKIQPGGNERLSTEHKILFEIFSIIHAIDTEMTDYWSLYTYTDTLLELEKCRVVLREGKEFDMIAYLIYFNNELSGPQQHTKVYADTFHSMFDGKISCKVQFEGFKKMTFRLDDISRIEEGKFLGVSTDPEGDNIIKKISQKDIEKGSTGCDIYFNQCYIHYPFNPAKIMGYGDGGNNRLGNDSTGYTSEPTEFKNFLKPIDLISCGTDYCCVVDNKGQLYYTGYKSSLGDTNTTLKKYIKKLPDEKIIKLLCGPSNVLLLTEDHKVYIEGYDYQYHISSYSTDVYEFKYKKRVEEEDEKVVDISLGRNYHAYITDNGKVYAAGYEFTTAFDIN